MVTSSLPVPSLSERLQAVRLEVLAVAWRHGAHNLRIYRFAQGFAYGSVARGVERPGSDLDLLVDIDQGHSLLEVITLRKELEALLGCRVDLAEPEQLPARIRDQVLAEARPL